MFVHYSNCSVDLIPGLVVNGDLLEVGVGSIGVSTLVVDLAVERITLWAVVLHLVNVEGLVRALVVGWFVLVDNHEQYQLLAVHLTLGQDQSLGESVLLVLVLKQYKKKYFKFL